MLQQINKV